MEIGGGIYSFVINKDIRSQGGAHWYLSSNMHQVLFKHQVNHLPLWQSLLQINDGSWGGYYSNGKGCQNHKGIATA